MSESRPSQVSLICDFCSSVRNFAHRELFIPQSGFLQIPPRDGHPCLRLMLPTTKRIVDFHHQVIAHAGRTTEIPRQIHASVLPTPISPLRMLSVASAFVFYSDYFNGTCLDFFNQLFWRQKPCSVKLRSVKAFFILLCLLLPLPSQGRFCLMLSCRCLSERFCNPLQVLCCQYKCPFLPCRIPRDRSRSKILLLPNFRQASRRCGSYILSGKQTIP